MNTERRTRLIRVCAVIGVALAVGHVAQSGPRNASFASVMHGATPVDVVPLSATTESEIGWTNPDPSDADQPLLPRIAVRPEVTGPARLDVPPAVADTDCTPVLLVSPGVGAMIDVGLSAPCRTGERVVLRHAGLAVTYRTNSVGALTARLPALAVTARVSVLFAGGDVIEAELSMPEAAAFRRFGVQWLGPVAFGVNAFESGAGYGTPGHVSAADTGKPASGPAPFSGFLTVLGDDSVDQPILAEIYTFPSGSSDVPVVVEAAITAQTCGQEMMAETLNVVAGTVQKSDLSVAMPGCDAAGDFLLLKNLVPDMTLAAAN